MVICLIFALWTLILSWTRTWSLWTWDCDWVDWRCRFYGPLCRTTQVSQYQKKHSPILIIIQPFSFFHLLQSIASSLLNLRAWQSFCTSSVHIHLTILISARWSTALFSFLTGQVSLPCSILLRTPLLYSLPLLISDISLLLSNGTNCLTLFHPLKFWLPQFWL